MTKHNIRSKGTKTDEELAREWIECKKRVQFFAFFRENDPEKAKLIEKELGKERLEFLVCKLQTEDKIKEMEEKIEKINEKLQENGIRPIDPLPVCNAGYFLSATDTTATDTTIHKKKSFLSKCWGFVRNIDIENFLVNILLPITLFGTLVALIIFMLFIALDISGII